MIKILPLDFLGVSHRIPRKNKNAFYCLQISALVPDIFVFEKYIKYTNEITNDVIYSTQYYMKYINRAILSRPSKLGRLIVLKKKTNDYKNSVPMATHSFPVPTYFISNVGDFQLKKH